MVLMKEKETVKGKQLLLTFIRDHIWSYVAGILILLFSSFCAMLIPKILGIITDGLDKRNMAREQIYQYVLLMLGAIILVFIICSSISRLFRWIFTVITKQGTW